MRLASRGLPAETAARGAGTAAAGFPHWRMALADAVGGRVVVGFCRDCPRAGAWVEHGWWFLAEGPPSQADERARAGPGATASFDEFAMEQRAPSLQTY